MKAQNLVRKVQLMGGSTLMVSLPRNWAKAVGIKQGDYISMIIEPDGSLRILPFPQQGEKHKTVIVASKNMGDESLLRELMSRYLTGFEIITIKFEDSSFKHRRFLKEAISKKLIGVEILDETADRITLQVLVNVEGLPVNTILQRMGYVASGMLADAISGLSTFDKELLEDVVERDDVVDKFYLYVLRQLNAVTRGYLRLSEIGLTRVEETLQYGVVAKSIERVADHAQRIARNVLEIVKAGSKPDARLIGTIEEFSNAVRETFRASVKAFVNRDRKTAHHILNTSPQGVLRHEREIIGMITSIRGDVMLYLPLRLIVDSLKRIVDYSMDISEATIDLTVENQPKA